MIKASVNKNTYEIESVDDTFMVNGKAFEWDMEKISDNYFHIIHDHKSYTAEVVKVDMASRKFDIKVNGNIYAIELKDRFDLLLEKMGMTGASSAKVNNIKAPMPGLIIDLKVKAGDPVKQGETLLILEAMKMENIIKSPGEGTVRTVKVKKGDSVEKNQVLIEF